MQEQNSLRETEKKRRYGRSEDTDGVVIAER